MMQKSVPLAPRDVRHVFGRPDLTMRMWITGAHRFSTVLEDLDVCEIRMRAEILVLLGPHGHDTLHLLGRKLRHREIMPRGKANDAADTTFSLCKQQIPRSV